ncbi:hypothetical protein NE556_19615, partial [[Clostridium] symbiosum]|uniref:hypothetical protein n=1 Tax=Clostridium symbiosum TaxID=1512 RepID=UPI00210C9C0E
SIVLVCRQGWRTLPVSKYICNLQGSFTPGSPAIGFHKSLDTTPLLLYFPFLLRFQFYKSDRPVISFDSFIIPGLREIFQH